MIARHLVCVMTVALALAAGARAQPAPATSDKADALSDAVRKGDVAAVKKLLDEGVDVNTKYRYNRTPLSFAADRGHVAVVKLLLERGADINAKDTFYNASALNWAVAPASERTANHTEVVRLLVAKGGIPAEDLTRHLELATRMKLADVVEILEKAGDTTKPK